MRNATFHLLLVLLAMIAGTAGAQPGAPRQLPAQDKKPPDVVEHERLEGEAVTPPPPKGKAKGKLLRASPAPPPDVAAEQQAEAASREAGPPPAKGKPEDLLRIIESRPGGKERADAARQGRPPRGPGRPDSAAVTAGEVLDGVLSFFVPSAYAGETLTIDLTPQVDSYGRHSSLYSSSPYASALFYGAYVSSSYPRNDSIRIYPTSLSGVQHSTDNPYARLYFNVPETGWYILNANATVSGSDNVAIRHYEYPNYVLVEDLPRQSGWADYPTLQYLEAGNHSFYWVFPRGAYISRISVDSYP